MDGLRSWAESITFFFKEYARLDANASDLTCLPPSPPPKSPRTLRLLERTNCFPCKLHSGLVLTGKLMLSLLFDSPPFHDLLVTNPNQLESHVETDTIYRRDALPQSHLVRKKCE